ncbi:C-C chemokine receptor type 5-like [Lampris incognitus]|uniref:C-C chemokine receptor type 5-like n=1 Tax=Lampris incognitus TaxID=2546036 RepID=UPI0024B60788|nr:C-C chemokine receptor type 5-like [Lampris incognitus]
MNDSEPNTVAEYGDYYNVSWAGKAPCDYSKVRDFGMVFLPTLYSFVFITGFIGNGLVACVLVKNRNETNLTDICLLNLSISDLLFIISLPFIAHYAAAAEWVFGDFLCRFVCTIFTLGFYNSTFIMVVMTLDRYVVIVHAHTLAHHRTLRVGMALTVFVWLLSVCISLPYMIFTQVRNDSGVLRCDYYTDSQGWKDFNILAMNIFGLLLPLLIMVACYSRIIPILMVMRSNSRHRSIKLIIIIVVIFFLFWAPHNITMFLSFLQSRRLLQNDCQREEAISFSILVTEAIAFTHCCLNPIIYAFVGQKFRERVLRLLRNWFPCCSLLSSRDM